MSKYVFTKEHREALGRAAKGRKLSPEHRKKISLVQIGRKASKATRQKMGRTRRKMYASGFSLSEEARKKIGEANRKRLTPEYLREHPTWLMLHARKGVRMNTGRTLFKKGEGQNEDNSQWRGDRVSYSGLHAWVESHLGIPRKCENCETTTAKKYEWANISKEYRRDVNDFIRLCTSCHRRFDYGLITISLPHRK